ncbi:MAG TPA: hypothetical protein DEA08_20055, partial [Planctomycetes bacterium]|nr:hypothetical protein [Planctomycetota bacterium]
MRHGLILGLMCALSLGSSGCVSVPRLGGLPAGFFGIAGVEVVGSDETACKSLCEEALERASLAGANPSPEDSAANRPPSRLAAVREQVHPFLVLVRTQVLAAMRARLEGLNEPTELLAALPTALEATPELVSAIREEYEEDSDWQDGLRTSAQSLLIYYTDLYENRLRDRNGTRWEFEPEDLEDAAKSFVKSRTLTEAEISPQLAGRLFAVFFEFLGDEAAEVPFFFNEIASVNSRVATLEQELGTLTKEREQTLKSLETADKAVVTDTQVFISSQTRELVRSLAAADSRTSEIEQELATLRAELRAVCEGTSKTLRSYT